jgi:pimeloyl-ACP methyl ester carboxylesterase
MKRKIKTVLFSFAFIILFFSCCIIVHHILLSGEKSKIISNGTIVEVNGYNMHVYSVGKLESEFSPLVFMSGAGTVSPVYDFKPLYSLLSDYHIIVVEKIGYGYSDIADAPRDIDTMLNETRGALKLTGKEGPYILVPHSMSGLEALYWAQKYPDEIKAIIGIDMATPEVYEHLKVNSAVYAFLGFLAKTGIQRISFVYPISTKGLTPEEQGQLKYLTYRNAINKTMANESKCLFTNAKKVKETEYPKIPCLLFSSDGSEMGDYWVKCQEDFAKITGAELIKINCGHYIHQFEAEKLSEEIKLFLEKKRHL